jgi:hypothetical protein
MARDRVRGPLPQAPPHSSRGGVDEYRIGGDLRARTRSQTFVAAARQQLSVCETRKFYPALVRLAKVATRRCFWRSDRTVTCFCVENSRSILRCPASVADRRRPRSRRCAVPTAKHPRNRHTQQQSQSSTRAMAACQPRNQPPRRTRRSRAHTFRISQIPIAECAASSAPIPRGFFPWRLSDAGHWCMSRRCRWPASETLHKNADIFAALSLRRHMRVSQAR